MECSDVQEYMKFQYQREDHNLQEEYLLEQYRNKYVAIEKLSDKKNAVQADLAYLLYLLEFAKKERKERHILLVLTSLLISTIFLSVIPIFYSISILGFLGIISINKIQSDIHTLKGLEGMLGIKKESCSFKNLCKNMGKKNEENYTLFNYCNKMYTKGSSKVLQLENELDALQAKIMVVEDMIDMIDSGIENLKKSKEKHYSKLFCLKKIQSLNACESPSLDIDYPKKIRK